MVQLHRMLRLAISLFVCQPKGLTVQSWPTTARMLVWGAIHHAVFGQADQEVRVHFALCQRLQVVTTIERHHRTWCTYSLGVTHSGDLLQRHLRRRLRRGST